MPTEIFTASTTWVCPAGVTTLTSVVCYGKGGNGGNNSAGKTGGGGGGYSASTAVAVTPAASYTITVDGTKSSFGADVVRANAGPNGANDQSTTSGASTSGAVGTVKYAGGKAGYVWTSEGGGGGGGAGPSGNGGDGNGRTAGTGNGSGAGAGGIGGWLNYGGLPLAGNGTDYGGGGGGGATGKASGTGASGAVIISYTTPASMAAEPRTFTASGSAGLLSRSILTAAARQFQLLAIPSESAFPNPVYRVELQCASGQTIDVTDRVLQASWDRGVSNYVRGFENGTADIVLANDTGSLSPIKNALLRPNIGVTIKAAASSYSAWRTLFTGNVDRITVNPALNSPRNTILSCRDRSRDLSSRRVDTGIQTNINVGSLVALVLDSALITARSIDQISQTFPFAWFTDTQVANTIEEVIAAGGYASYVTGDGTFRFRDRFWDLGGEVVASYDLFTGLSYALDEANVVNKIRVTGEPRLIVDSVQTIASLGEAITMAPGEIASFWLDYEDPAAAEAAPAVNVIWPVSSVDYLASSSLEGAGTDLTSALTLDFTGFAESCISTLTNTSTLTSHLRIFGVRGQPIQRQLTVSVEADQLASQSLYGIKDGTLETRLLGNHAQMKSRADDIIDLFGTPSPQIEMAITNQWPDVLINDLADIVHITEPHVGIAAQYTIQQVAHQLDAESRGWVHQVSYVLEESKAVDVFIVSSSLSGIIGTNRLGRRESVA